METATAIRLETTLRRSLPPPAECRRRRLALDLSAETVGNAIGVSGQAIRSWELGIRRPRRGHLERYIEALEVMAALASESEAA
jgi:transcriptional regulator with XRE-family HTH domain